MAMSIGASCESGAVVVRAHVQAATEGPAHRLDGAEAALPRHVLDGVRAGFERLAGALHAKRLDVGPWRLARLPSERPGEVARAHPRAPRQGSHGEVLIEVVAEPELQL